MAQTKKANVFIPEVAVQSISAGLPKAIKFMSIATMDDTLVGVAGDTVTVPKWAYVGDATVVAEGTKIDLKQMSQTTQKAKIEKVGNGVEITDEVKLSGYGDPFGEATHQLLMSIASAIDNKIVEVLKTATLTSDSQSKKISYEGIVDAVDKFNEEEDVEKVLFVHPSQITTLRKDANFIDKSKYGNDVMVTGEIGMIAGCRVVKSLKIDASGSTINNFIVQMTAQGKDGRKPLPAVTIYRKTNPNVEQDRDIVAKTTVITADQHFAVALTNDAKVLKVTFLK